MRPFEGIKVIDCTHVLAGPFATYQLALLGADVIKVENPRAPDQSRINGPDMDLNHQWMGTGFLTQGANKRVITVDLKRSEGQDIIRRLVRDQADVFVENFRPGAFRALGLDYDSLSKINPAMIYLSVSAYGQTGRRSSDTNYDMGIQASSGIFAGTGSLESGPMKTGGPITDYSSGFAAAFAIAAALYQRTHTATGQYIDLAMQDVALILQSSQITGAMFTGKMPRLSGNLGRFAEMSTFETKDGLVQVAAVNTEQHRRFYRAIDEPEEAERCSLEERHSRYEEKYNIIKKKMIERTAEEWESYLQSHRVPAARIRDFGEAIRDSERDGRAAFRRIRTPGISEEVTVPMTPFAYLHDGPKIDRPPARLGDHTNEVLESIGFDQKEIAAYREAGIVA